MKLAALLFGLHKRVTRRTYLLWGFGLAVAKYLIDTGLVLAFTGKTWTPLGYIVPSYILRRDAVGSGPEAMYVVLPIVALPFLWIGLSMSVRRAIDAGVSPWSGTLFLVPFVNYVTMATLAVLPSRRDSKWELPPSSVYRQQELEPPPPPSGEAMPSGVRAALLGLAASMAVGVAMVGLCVFGIGAYGVTLFFSTPFAMGAASAAIYNRGAQRDMGATMGIAVAGVLLTGSALLLFAIEGILCLAMAAPIAIVIAIFGAIVGRAIVGATRRGMAGVSAMMVVLPGLAAGEAQLAKPPMRDVTTAIEIDAPPEAVWPNVIGFSELDEPPSWFFRLGIAYPKRAVIEGSGVGAVRHCEFSTGPFVEPVTVWEPPSRLAFDVTAQPPSMTEWSPYARVHAPHLEGYMTSKGGEFDLVRLRGGRTRLEGTTHYTLAIYPAIYWTPFAEGLLHAIHARVLSHIKNLSEASNGDARDAGLLQLP